MFMDTKIKHIEGNVIYVEFSEERINPEDVMTEEQLLDFKFLCESIDGLESVSTSEWNALIKNIIKIDETFSELIS